MCERIKLAGLAIAALMAVSLMGVSSASAANGELHAGASVNASAVLVGHQQVENVFQVTSTLAEGKGPKVRCAQATFEGTVQGKAPQVTTQELTLTPTYSNCTAFGQNATVRMNGCKYTVTGGQPEPLTALVDIAGCTAGKKIEIQTGICQVKVPDQSGLGHIVFENKAGPPEHVEAQATISGIAHEYSAGIGCGHTKAAVTNDGTYHGKVTFKAFEDDGTEQVTELEHQFDRSVAGAQEELSAT